MTITVTTSQVTAPVAGGCANNLDVIDGLAVRRNFGHLTRNSLGILGGRQLQSTRWIQDGIYIGFTYCHKWLLRRRVRGEYKGSQQGYKMTHHDGVRVQSTAERNGEAEAESSILLRANRSSEKKSDQD